MREKFRKKLRVSPANKYQLDIINKIIEEYKKEGYILTLRQLYYQLVSRDIIPNKQSEYAKLSTLLTKGRMAGIVDWSAIEDRNRKPYIPSAWDSPESIVESAIHSYRRNRQEGQAVYIELWVEKDALSGVLKRITKKYHINLIVNKGYSSTSAMYDAYERVKDKLLEKKKVVILYLGDHDASGLDMIRDIRDRIREFISNSEDVKSEYYDLDEDSQSKVYEDLDGRYNDACEYPNLFEKEDQEEGYFEPSNAYALDLFEKNVEVRPIGLTMKQIKKFSPPPNPAKITDPRAKWYIEKFGQVSWEVDALNPETLHKLVKKNVEELIDLDLFNEQLKHETMDKDKLKGFAFK